MRHRRGLYATAALLSAALLLGACNGETVPPPQPQSPDGRAVSYFCAMTMAEHGGPGGQIFVRDRKGPVWLSSVRDAFAYLELEGVPLADVRAFYVTDMSSGWGDSLSAPWIEARKALFVIGSDKDAAMGGKEAVPFADAAAAQAFAARHGGQVVEFEAARRAMALDTGPSEPEEQ